MTTLTAVPHIILYTNHLCPFCHRVEFLLRLKGLWEYIDVRTINMRTPRPAWFLEKTGGTTSVPVLELADGSIIKESLTILRYLEDTFPGHAPTDSYQRAVLIMWICLEGGFRITGHQFIINSDASKRTTLAGAYVAQAKKLDSFLLRYAPHSTFLFAESGIAEAVFAPYILRYTALLTHYELWDFPSEGLERFLKYRDAVIDLMNCPEQSALNSIDIVKAYYDYATNGGNFTLPEGRTKSSVASATIDYLGSDATEDLSISYS